MRYHVAIFAAGGNQNGSSFMGGIDAFLGDERNGLFTFIRKRTISAAEDFAKRSPCFGDINFHVLITVVKGDVDSSVFKPLKIPAYKVLRWRAK